MALLANRPALRRAFGEAGSFRDVLGALRRAAAVRARQDLGDGVEVVFEIGASVAEAGSPERLRAALERGERLADRDGRRVVIFLDEFQEVVGAGKRVRPP